ncbi:helix-turn-helix domain protein [Clostridium sp. DL-VIII]|uniref:helix-turn-helix domain-containing protein n=1 Tax=Clostridium sp. DL-VIII TaxID=641107 RepID=UPI00023B051B|nr:helix-turn-helix transcriptional regulator [Clostridium sp. DL-VIII]EHJ01967.1 helix-turn-helix domain protein [Clostridium sp. DL-VIII]
MNDINFIEMGKRIKLEREKNNMTRDQLAESVGISNVYLTQLERSDRQGSLAVICKIASVLNISLDYLIYGNDSIKVDKESIIEKINTLNSKRELKVIDEILNTIIPNLKK